MFSQALYQSIQILRKRNKFKYQLALQRTHDWAPVKKKQQQSTPKKNDI